MVAVKTQQADSFLKSLDQRITALLYYGGDAGLVSERAARAAKALAARESPPGEIVRLDDADLETDADRLAVELQTVAMFGGRKIVRATAGRRINAAYIAPLLEPGRMAGLLVVEAGNLKPDEGMRPLFEKSSLAAAIACFPDQEQDLAAMVREVLDQQKLKLTAEARELLLQRLGADRALSRAEVEKLALYAMGRPEITVDDVDAIVGDASEQALDRVVAAAFAGRASVAVRELDRALAAGESPQGVVSATLRHAIVLHRLKAQIDAGRSLDDALRQIRPPVHFKVRDRLTAEARRWTLERAASAVSRIASVQGTSRLNAPLEATLVERLLVEITYLAGAPLATKRP